MTGDVRQKDEMYQRRLCADWFPLEYHTTKRTYHVTLLSIVLCYTVHQYGIVFLPG